MRAFDLVLVSVLLLAAPSVDAQTAGEAPPSISVSRRAAPSVPMPQPRDAAGSSNFTGAVAVQPVFRSIAPGRASGSDVTFAPGARTAWHTHPAGQTLIVAAGVGRVQQWGSPAEEIRPGDVVRIPPGVKHWHGASPDSAMTHLAIGEPIEGNSVTWMEPVTDAEYLAQPRVQSLAPPPQDQRARPQQRPSGSVQPRIAPGMAEYTDDVLFGDVWLRPQLSPRDRSLVTIAVLIATGKPEQLQGHLGRALTNGVQPREASGVLTHLAIYYGWPSAVVALDVYDRVYTARNIDTASLRAAAPPLPVHGWDVARARTTNARFGTVAPKFTQLTNDVVFGSLWRRPDLSVRDRSLVTIAALAAMGDDEQLDFYLRLAIESGLTREQIAEAFTHLAFYAGWARATDAMTAAVRTFGAGGAPPR